MKRTGVILLAAAALGPSAGVAEACSALLKPVEQVVREAEVILRARAMAPEPWWRTSPGQVVLRVGEVLKGSYERPFISVIGQLGEYRADPGRRPPYQQIDCVGRVPGCANCFAQRYREGAEYLFLLKEGTPYWAPLSPTNEEVSGPSDPWVRWVRRQVVERAPSP